MTDPRPVPRLAYSSITISPKRFDEVLRFYTQALCMTVVLKRRTGDGRHLVFVGYAAPASSFTDMLRTTSPTLIALVKGVEEVHIRPDNARFWKHGVQMPDVPAGRAHVLSTRNVAVTTPWQLQDIGYLCHLCDPDGYNLELLQHELAPPLGAGPIPAEPGASISEHWHLGQISIRAARPKVYLSLLKALGMNVVASMSVDRGGGFDLHFAAFDQAPDGSTLTPPGEDPCAPSRRPWLWRQPFTQVEVLQTHTPVETDAYTTTPGCDWRGMTIAVADIDATLEGVEFTSTRGKLGRHKTARIAVPYHAPIHLIEA